MHIGKLAWLVALFAALDASLALSDDAPLVVPPNDSEQSIDPIQSLNGAAQYFTAAGLDEAFFDRFSNGPGLATAELAPLAELLVALEQIPPEKINEWARRNLTSHQLGAEPIEHRGEVLHLRGIAQQVTLENLPTELTERFDLPRLYRCKIQLVDGGTAIVFTPHVPQKWKLDEPIQESVAFDGVFLKADFKQSASNESPDKSSPLLIFAAPRISWHSPTLLGKLGFDHGLLDDVTQNDSIDAGESATFYQLLAAAGRANLDELLAATRGQQWTIVPGSGDRPGLAENLEKLKQEHPGLQFYFLGQPQRFAGQLMAFEGRARSCVPVRISDVALARRLGFDTYYQLVIFVDLQYRLKLRSSDGKQNEKVAAKSSSLPKEVGTFPIVACVRQIPPGFPTGDRLSEPMRVPGFFFKQWAFRSLQGTTGGGAPPDLSPLIIGPGLVWTAPPAPTAVNIPLAVGCALGLAGAAIGLLLWQSKRRGHGLRAHRADSNLPPSDEFSFPELNVKHEAGRPVT